MEKETLLTGFNERLGNPDANGMYEQAGVSQRTLDAYVDGLLPTITDDAEVNDTFWERHVNFIKAMGGQMRHEKADFVKNYKPAPTPAPAPAPPADGNGEMAKLLERMEALENERKEEKRQLAVKGLRADVKAKAGAMNVSNKALWNDAVDLVECKDDMDAEAVAKEAKRIYEKKLKEYFGDGATPYGGNGGGGSASEEATKARREAFKKRMQSQGRLPKDEEKN